MDRAQLLLLGLPLILLCSDLINLFTPPPPPKPSHHHHHHHHKPPPPTTPTAVASDSLRSQNPDSAGGGLGLGSSFKIDFCSSCSYRGTALNMKNMLEGQFPGIEVLLENYPAPLPKRVFGKMLTVVQIGVVAIVTAGEQIFPMLGFMTPPPWYYSLSANKFRTIASTWLLGNALQSFLQGSGAFEVYCNDQLIFSKLKEGRFPGEIELRNLVGRRLAGDLVLNRVWTSGGVAPLFVS